MTGTVYQVRTMEFGAVLLRKTMVRIVQHLIDLSWNVLVNCSMFRAYPVILLWNPCIRFCITTGLVYIRSFPLWIFTCSEVNSLVTNACHLVLNGVLWWQSDQSEEPLHLDTTSMPLISEDSICNSVLLASYQIPCKPIHTCTWVSFGSAWLICSFVVPI